MRKVNTLWCIVERSLDGSGEHRVMKDEVFRTRRDARDYLRAVKSNPNSSFCTKPRGLFIRQLRVTSKRG